MRLAWLVAAVLALRLAVSTLLASSVPANGFVAHWTASRLVLDGRDVSAFYDDAWFAARVGETEPGVVDIFGANPPTVALAALPVAWMPYRTARLVVAMLSVVLWIGGAAWLATMLLPGSLLGPLLVTVAAVFQPAEEGLRHAQLHIPVFGAVLVAWHHWRRAQDTRHSAFVGVSLGSVLALKATGAVFAIMLVVQRRWSALAWMIATVVALALASLPVAGADAWTAFAARAQALGASGTFSVAAYQTVPGLVRRLTVMDSQWNPRPLVDAGRLGIAASWLAILALVVVTAVVAARRHAGDDSIFAAFAALSVIASPVSLDYHYVLTLLPIAILFAREREEQNEARMGLLGLAVLLIAARLPHLSPSGADGARALLAYPKLYGALLLWWLALTSGRIESSSHAVQTTFVLERAAA
jgi:hypothetical protein